MRCFSRHCENIQLILNLPEDLIIIDKSIILNQLITVDNMLENKIIFRETQCITQPEKIFLARDFSFPFFTPTGYF